MLLFSQIPGRITSAVAVLVFFTCSLEAQDTFVYQSVEATNKLVPQRLLALAHAPEVQKEIGVSESNLSKFEAGLRLIDRIWWPARLLEADQQRKIVSELEGKLDEMVADVVGQKGLIRLHQIELQAQAIRMLARPDIQQFLKLDSQQVKKIETLFQATDAIAKQISPTKPDTAKQEELQSANKKEMTEGFAVLKPEQAQRLSLTFGKEFNTAVLERIYPLAPEFVGAEKQLKSIGSNWQELKGKVVLVHFYAYECHNCHANFPHYNRWHTKLKSKGVEVVGIQTPETANEKVAENIIRAAKKDGFQFPVVLDLDSQNWKSWGNTMWPTVYVVDKNGYIRFWWQGELNWNGATVDKTIEKLVEQLLEE